jgi:hypothetical protein
MIPSLETERMWARPEAHQRMTAVLFARVAVAEEQAKQNRVRDLLQLKRKS